MLNLDSLNPQQRLAVETINGPVLILAGAGTGKTRVITYRIVHMIEEGIAPANILGVTFTNKAAREMQERVTRLVPRSKQNSAFRTPHSALPCRPTICTFHSLCVRILRQHIEKLGYRRNFVIYDESEQLGVIKKILSRISAEGEKTDPAAILTLLSRYRNQVGQASSLSPFSGTKRLETGRMPVPLFDDSSAAAMAEHVRSRYETILRACNAVDFDDLILLTLRLFKEHPDALKACRAKYRHVMVDEYQDTNAAQFRLVHALTREHRNLCVVGDDDQSIYAWRGAEITNLLDMEKHYPEVKVIKLEQNYRSTNIILSAANSVIRNNLRRRGKQLWSAKGQGAKIILHTFENEEAEARTIVEEIEFMRQARRISWSQQAILFRTNQQSRPLETALRQAPVRYHLVGGQSFFDRREVKDFLAYLKVFLNPNDDISLLRIANVPARGLSDVTMERLLASSQERKCSVFTAMKNPAVQATFLARTRESIEAFVAFIGRTRSQLTEVSRRREHPDLSSVPVPTALGPDGSLRQHSPSPRPSPPGEGEPIEAASPSSLSMSRFRSADTHVGGHEAGEARALQSWAQRFLVELGYLDELRRSEKDAEAAESRVRNLRDLAAAMDGNMSLAPVERLQSFLEELALDSDRDDEKEPAGDAVTLITMHSCKGLEFPHVYIVGLEDGLLPHSRSKVDGTLDEERRLFYVAITRAMQSLTISYCTGRKKYGQLMPGHPSPFLKELPAELVEHAGAKNSPPIDVEAGKGLFDAMRASLE
ncbi:MAG: DNA helicase UvrD [Verrucomicrobia bacterium]|nr:MAG: DNA helicase UvrD [Verrucomicrobiota bacterium]